MMAAQQQEFEFKPGDAHTFEFVKALHDAAPWKYQVREMVNGRPARRRGLSVVYARCYSDGSIYIGQTGDLARRDRQHRNGSEKSTGLHELAAAEDGDTTRSAILWSWDISKGRAVHDPERLRRKRERWWITTISDAATAHGGFYKVLNRQAAGTTAQRDAARKLRRLRAEEWLAGRAGCIEQCMTAQSDECECRCDGRYHGCYELWTDDPARGDSTATI